MADKAGARWRALRHEGVRFPPPYKPLGAPLVVRPSGARVRLPAEAEELAVAYGRWRDRQRGEGAAQLRLADRNFAAGWLALLPPAVRRAVGDDPGAWDFRALVAAAEARAAAAAAAAARRPKAKAPDAAAARPRAWMDGAPHAVDGDVVEGASIFTGRGRTHPLRGAPKRRVRAEDVTLNLSRGARVPAVPPPGGRWGAVVHEPGVDWIARWRDPATRAMKYVRLASNASPSQEQDEVKFEAARALHAALPGVRRALLRDLRGGAPARATLAACAWLVDRLAIRAGSEASRRAAGVHGATTLTVGHVRATPGSPGLRVRFLGKDSVPFDRQVAAPRAACSALDAEGLRAVRALCSGRPPAARLFPGVDAARLNEYLGALHPGLTSKVMRTHHASAAFEEALGQAPAGAAPLAALHVAWGHAAALCNHRSLASGRGGEEEAAALRALLAGPRDGGACAAATGSVAAARALVARARLLPRTTRTNYIDPRIAVAFCLRAGLPVADALGPAGSPLARRFAWAVRAPQSFRWHSAAR